jgi:hypothetical protein
LSEANKVTHRRKLQVRAKVEHPFLVLKRLWGFAKVRYRGLAKNANRAFAMLALANLVKWGRPLTGEVRPKYRETWEIPPIPGLSSPFFQRKRLIYSIFIHFGSIFVPACLDWPACSAFP